MPQDLKSNQPTKADVEVEGKDPQEDLLTRVAAKRAFPCFGEAEHLENWRRRSFARNLRLCSSPFLQNVLGHV